MRCFCAHGGRIHQIGFMYLTVPDGGLIYFPIELVQYSTVLAPLFNQGQGNEETDAVRVLCSRRAIESIINDLTMIINGHSLNFDGYETPMLQGLVSCAGNLGIDIVQQGYRQELNQRNQAERTRRLQEEERQRRERIEKVERLQREREEQERRMEEERQRQLPTRENAYRALGVLSNATPWEILGITEGAPFTAIRSAYLRLKDAWTKQMGVNPLAPLVLEILEEAYNNLR